MGDLLIEEILIKIRYKCSYKTDADMLQVLIFEPYMIEKLCFKILNLPPYYHINEGSFSILMNTLLKRYSDLCIHGNRILAIYYISLGMNGWVNFLYTDHVLQNPIFKHSLERLVGKRYEH